jgi:hypothetical protein
MASSFQTKMDRMGRVGDGGGNFEKWWDRAPNLGVFA